MINVLPFAVPTYFFYQNRLVIQSVSDNEEPSVGHFFEIIRQDNFSDSSFPFYFRWVSQSDMQNAWEREARFILAAGGLVSSEDKKKLLLILRNGKWDIPKGKVEYNEPIAVSALREVKEETGLDVRLTNSTPMEITYHLYRDEYRHGAFVIKQTSWFDMEAIQNNMELVPQVEEGIQEVCWCSASEWEERRKNTFPIVDMLVKKSLAF